VGESLRELYRRFSIDCLVATSDTITEEFRKGSPFLAGVQKEERLLYMRDSVREWVQLAKEDLRQAEYLFQGAFYRGSCFAARQAVDKGLEAALLEKAGSLRGFTTFADCSVSRKNTVSISFANDADVDFMDSIYGGRYPAEEGLLPIKHPNADDAQRAIAAAKSALVQLSLFP